ncbi:MAG: outer membrane insertion C- signal [Cyclobacteriaceae bacterium]
MKKIILLFALFVGISSLAQAQELGVRFGDVTGGNVAIDALFSTSKFSMLHTDVSFGNNGIGVDALWDFIYKPLGDIPMNWYAGVGPTVFLGNTVLLAGSAELGLSYKIDDVPISISADWRPTLVLIETTDLYFGSFGVNVRYVFK